ncbi:decapping and exoribonuclease protein-like [Venturia canescens]|uniref:decapping and exoribonuclease protein-like n=1 Tax=Venturia canescens TaxID=32260 RepID=UPI001C9D19F3|nr:decapping and exoribonuclease protein-like [Venturia canescens]
MRRRSTQTDGTHDRSRYLGIPRPKTINYFSVDEDKNIIPDSSSIKYFHPSRSNNVAFDLNRGMDLIEADGNFLSFADSPGIETTLKWIVANHEKIKASSGDRMLQPNFVSTLGILTRFMGAPYAQKDRWQLLAGKFEGNIYLRSIRSKSNRDEAKFGYWGHKFQNYMVSECPDEAPQPDEKISRHEEFRYVYQQKFSKHSVLYTGVRKAVLSKKLLEDPLLIDNLEFIDLRTHKKIVYQTQEKSLKMYKFLAWWANAFLTNDVKVLCGFRDDNGIVNELKTYEIEELAQMSKKFWHPEVCLKACQTLLSEIAEIVINDCDETIYELTKVDKENFDVRELKPSEKIAVVPEWYKKAMKQ